MPFKIGDRVRCIDAGAKPGLHNGHEYVVTRVEVYDGRDFVSVDNRENVVFARRFELVPNAEEGALGVVNEENGAIMLSPNVVKNTQLFKNVAPHIHSISVEELLFNLCKCVIRDMDYEFSDINNNITWAETPQGAEFWQPLHSEYARNKGGW